MYRSSCFFFFLLGCKLTWHLHERRITYHKSLESTLLFAFHERLKLCGEKTITASELLLLLLLLSLLSAITGAGR